MFDFIVGCNSGRIRSLRRISIVPAIFNFEQIDSILDQNLEYEIFCRDFSVLNSFGPSCLIPDLDHYLNDCANIFTKLSILSRILEKKLGTFWGA